MGRIAVHEFISLDGVIETPTWTFEYPFDPRMGEAIGAVIGPSTAILLGRTTYEQFAPAWSTRTAEDAGYSIYDDLVHGWGNGYLSPVLRTRGTTVEEAPSDFRYPENSTWVIQPNVITRDERMGICMDVGHTVRVGVEPVAAIHECASRLYDFHIKDSLAAAGAQCLEQVVHKFRTIHGHDAERVASFVAQSTAFEADFVVTHLLG